MNDSDDLYLVIVEGAIYKEDRYLLITRGPEEEFAAGVLAFPGGKVDGNTVADAVLESTLRREICEEVGVEVGESMTYVESVSFEGNSIYCLGVVFLCEYRSGTPRIDDPGEVAAIHWMTAQDVLNHPDAPPWLKQSITRAERIRTRLAD